MDRSAGGADSPRRSSTVARVARAAARFAPLVAASIAAASCHEIDTTRVAQPVATLGDDLYGALCDRLGASVLAEDTSGQSFQAICHFDDEGKYGNEIDTSVLPPTTNDVATKARERSIAKMRAMARWRRDLIRAFNALFPDIEIDDVTTEDAGDTVRLHDAAMTMTQKLVPLYESNPFDEDGEPLFPAQTRAMGRLLGALTENAGAKEALSRIWARQGYRPFQVAMGAMRSALAYPDLRGFSKASLAVLGPNGAAAPQLQQLFAVGKREMFSAKPTVQPLPPFRIENAAIGQPNRARSALEMAGALLLDESAAYSDGAPPHFIAKRDRRGFVVPLGSVPGQTGTLTSPFADADNDGFADVDGFGRFIDAGGAPIALDAPFAIPQITSFSTDEFGRPATPLYEYVDTSQTALGAVARSLRHLVVPEGPELNEALMDALAGAYVLYGPREEATFDYSVQNPDGSLGKRLLPGEQCSSVGNTCITYSRFRGEDSPLVELIHAAGPLLADPDSDTLLLGLIDLVENHEQEVARLLGAALKLRQIAKDHDALADQGKEPFAEMAYSVPIWDEIADVLARGNSMYPALVDKPGFMAKVVSSFSDPVVVSQQGTSKHMGETLAAFFLMKDMLTYDPSNLNGPAINTTDGGGVADPKHPVDQTKPKTGLNRSIWERTLQVMHDVRDTKACNKQNAQVFVDIFGGTVLPVEYDECDIFEIGDLGSFYLGSLLPPGHPKRAEMSLKGALGDLLDIADTIGISPDELLENSSNINGMTRHPTPQALNRLVFFGAETELYPMPDIDPFVNGINDYPNQFISNLLWPVGSASCPKDSSGVPVCPSPEGTLRVKDPATLFTWERLGFLPYLAPVAQAFAEYPCLNDVSACSLDGNKTNYIGERRFIEIIDIMYRHWSTDGGNKYEPILADSFKTDLIPALHEISKVSTNQSKVTVARGPNAGDVWTGADVLEKTVQILFSKDYAAKMGLKDLKGNAGTTWTDGTPQSQVTMFTLFADALHHIDTTFDAANAGDRKAQWKSARSALVDEFLKINGEGTNAKFANPATPKVLAKVLRLMREQVNANCPNRETGGGCAWARTELPTKMANLFSDPLFAALMDVQESLRADPGARVATEKLLMHILGDGEDFAAAMASFADVVQVLLADNDMAPIVAAIAPMANPADDPDGAGVADRAVRVLLAATDDQYDPYHVLDYVLKNAVLPMENGKDRAPIEVIADAIADVHRIDAAFEESAPPLEAKDYGNIMSAVGDFVSSETRGLEQFYFIVQHRPQQ